jgi:hypothetical protein
VADRICVVLLHHFRQAIRLVFSLALFVLHHAALQIEPSRHWCGHAHPALWLRGQFEYSSALLVVDGSRAPARRVDLFQTI